MNMMDKWAATDRLRGLIAWRMIEGGEVLFHRSQSNAYVGIDIYEVRKFGHDWRIIFVDGAACEIERID